MKIWSWRQAVAKADIPALTKLVLYTLANYMNEHGGGCYPSVETIKKDSGLSKQSVITHLDIAERHGFIKRKKHGFAGQKWARNEYLPAYPAACTIGEAQGNCDDNKDSQADRPPISEGGQSNDERQSTTHKNVVNDVDTNSPVNSPENTSITPLPPEDEKLNFLEAIKIIEIFDQVIIEVFGKSQARPWPKANDTVYAERFIEAGVPPSFCKAFFSQKQAEFKAQGKQPITGLKYFERAIPEAWLDMENASSKPLPTLQPVQERYSNFLNGGNNGN